MEQLHRYITIFTLLCGLFGSGSSAIVKNYTTVTEHTFQVPLYVEEISVYVYGASGGEGAYNGGAGGQGGWVQATLSVTAGDTLYFRVGGQGGNGVSNGSPGGGYNGGGSATYNCGCSSWNPGGGGGGASDVRYGNNSLAARIIVAGGGGGGSNGKTGTAYAGGKGGNSTGQAGGGPDSAGIYYGGGGGTQSSGGSGSGGGGAGSLGQGGNGAGNINYGSGGGGGGYYGGGGGGVFYTQGSAGGGGSHYAASTGVSDVVFHQGGRTGNGFISISYSAISATSISSSLNPSTAGDSITFTASVVGLNVTGTVFFYVNDSLLANATLDSSATVTFTTSDLTPGTYSIWASYEGDIGNKASDSPSVQQVVKAKPPVTTTTTGGNGGTTTGGTTSGGNSGGNSGHSSSSPAGTHRANNWWAMLFSPL